MQQTKYDLVQVCSGRRHSKRMQNIRIAGFVFLSLVRMRA
jgi:hypothetical protein